MRHRTRFRRDLQRRELVVFALGRHVLIGNDRVQVLVEHFAFLVGELLEFGERDVDRILAAEIDAELTQARLECVASGKLAEHELVRVPAHILRAHDLVRFAVLDHAVLMDPGFVRKGIRADDRLVGLHRKSRDARHHFRCCNDLRGIDARRARKHVLARTYRHHDLFQRGVPCALSQTVDRALHLPRAIHHRRKRVGHGKTQIIVAVHRPDGLSGIWNPLAQRLDQRTELPRHRVTDGIRDVDRSGAGADHRFEETAHEVGFGSARVFRRELDVVGITARPLHRFYRLLEHLLRRHP